MIGRKRTFNELKSAEEKEIEQQNDNIPKHGLTDEEIQSFPNLIKLYYEKLFPFSELCNWLSYFNDPSKEESMIHSEVWRNREFSFTLKDDIYVRFKSYANFDEFRNDIRKKVPYKIDIGAIYNVEPKRKSSVASDRFKPEEKELVFDIDISDYDDVRQCCQNADICNLCWPLMSCAIKIIDYALRNDFGLKHIFWVFSGRRGIHCWCCDPLVRKFNIIGRSSMIDYIKLYVGNSQNNIKVDLHMDKNSSIHAYLKYAYDVCVPYFVECSIKNQKIFDDERSIDYCCNMVRFDYIRNDLKNQLLSNIDREYKDKYKAFEDCFDKYISKKSTNNKLKRLILANKFEIIFSYCYPRLDIEVSKHMNHLLKSPFCVHPKTQKVCTIIDPEKCDEFDPLNQPTLSSLFNELNQSGKNHKISWRDTSLKNVVQTFRETFLNDLQKANACKAKNDIPDF